MINLLSGTLSDSTDPNQDYSLSTMHLVVMTCQLSYFQSGRPASWEPRPARRHGGVRPTAAQPPCPFRWSHCCCSAPLSSNRTGKLTEEIPARRPGRPPGLRVWWPRRAGQRAGRRQYLSSRGVERIGKKLLHLHEEVAKASALEFSVIRLCVSSTRL